MTLIERTQRGDQLVVGLLGDRRPSIRDVATRRNLLSVTSTRIRPTMAGDLVRGDAQQPRAQAGPSWFERRQGLPTTLERRCGEIVREGLVPNPAAHEAVDVVDVPAEQHCERVGVVAGADHECRVVDIVDRRNTRAVGAGARGQSRATSARVGTRSGIRTVSGRLRATIRSSGVVAITAYVTFDALGGTGSR